MAQGAAMSVCTNMAIQWLSDAGHTCVRKWPLPPSPDNPALNVRGANAAAVVCVNANMRTAPAVIVGECMATMVVWASPDEGGVLHHSSKLPTFVMGRVIS